MPRQNRVTPFGDLIATPARGAYMGNRGCLHDDDGAIVRWAQGTSWIICKTVFGDRRRQLMKPGSYTELFFLDEATALAAGHRPCWKCRRGALRHFRSAWRDGHGLDDRPSVEVVDAILDHHRRSGDQRWALYTRAADLPDGTFVDLDGNPHLVRDGMLLEWSPSGYLERRRPPLRPLPVLTPPPTVRALASGYQPQVDDSAGRAPLSIHRPDAASIRVASRHDVGFTPMADAFEVRPAERIYAGSEWALIRLGSIARNMDEKWSAFVDGNRLHLVRSWTGLDE